jgi:hypothetical protein
MLIYTIRLGECELQSFGFGQRPVIDFCEYGNELSGSKIFS